MTTLTLPNGTVLTQVTRRSCLDRIAAIPLESFAYSQTRIEPSTDKRADCTGWVSYVWDTPDSGPGIYLHAYNTASFYTQHVITRINWADLLPGDMIGYCSPTSPGNGGHAAIWMGGDHRPDGRFHVRDHGSGMGPKDRWVQWDGVSTGWLHPDHLAPWRYVAIDEGDPFMALTDKDQQALIWRVHALVSNLPTVAGGPTIGEVNELHNELARIRALAEAGQAPADVAAILAGVEQQLATLKSDLTAEIRDAVADLGEGGAAQVREDAS
jgi:hypothetical protein